ncbi:MAG: single-stranded DNA-binding protein [Candidatus Dojkabacteria bacterium]
MNKHTLMLTGHAVADMEELETKSGKKFRKLRVAVNEYKGEEHGEHAHFYDVTCFNGQPFAQAEEVKKGEAVMVAGVPRMSAYINKDGEASVNLGLNAKYLERH